LIRPQGADRRTGTLEPDASARCRAVSSATDTGCPGAPPWTSNNAVKVLTRQGLWEQGVRFGITDPFKKRHLVLINPGLSGLTARQILDRMLRGG
jgi:hypothetical protein